MRKYIFFLFLIFLTALTVTSCKVSKGFEALEVYNYFEAKKNFEKALKRHTSPAAYGLSLIYFRKDNPFHDVDSAYHYSLLSVESYKDLSDKKKEKIKEEYDLTYKDFMAHRAEIGAYFYTKAREKHTTKAYMDFAGRFPWSAYKDSAVYHRHALAFEQAKEKNTAAAYQRYIRHHKESPFIDSAKVFLEERQYKETTADQSLGSYERFLEIYPDNPFVDEAHDEIYNLIVEDNTVKEYEYFLKNYPKNPNVEKAWMNLYRLSTVEYTKETIEEFAEKHPDFPFLDMLYSDLSVVGKKLYPYKWKKLFGYMDENGLPLIPAQFQYAGLFNNGLAAVMKKDKYGYIDKNNDVIIDFIFDDALDFDHGRAIVEQNGYLGLIDKTGNFILSPIYDDIGNINNGVIYVFKNGKYGYFNLRGDQLYDRWFDEAYSFQNGLAKVIEGNMTGFIRKDGSYLIQKESVDLKMFSEGIFIYDLGDSLNLLDVRDSLILPNFVDRIGRLSENRAIIEKDQKFGYIDSLGNFIIPAEWEVYSNYFQFAQFDNGHAKVAKKDKFTLIDSLGEQILPAIFSNIGRFGALIPVTKDGKWGYTNEKARLKIKYIYGYAYPFIDGKAIVNKDGLFGTIDLNGEEVIPAIYYEIQRLQDSILIVHETPNQFGIVTTNGEKLTSFIYHRRHFVEDYLIQLEGQNKLDYFDVRRNKIITLLTEDE